MNVNTLYVQTVFEEFIFCRENVYGGIHFTPFMCGFDIFFVYHYRSMLNNIDTFLVQDNEWTQCVTNLHLLCAARIVE